MAETLLVGLVPGAYAQVTSSLQTPISMIYIKVPVAIFPLVKIQLTHPTKTRFDPEKVLRKTPHNVCSALAITQAAAVVVIRRASYEDRWARKHPRTEILYDVEVGVGGRDGEPCSDEECE
jgi:hypothetical protein